jgi:hypothetical protein
VHTGKGKDDKNDLYMDLDFYVWNNIDSDPSGDTAKLRNRDKKLIDKCSYSGGPSPKDC